MLGFSTLGAALVLASFASSNAHDGTYASASSKAFSSRRPLVVFVGVKSRPIDGVVSVRVDALEGYGHGSIVLSKPGASWLEWTATMPAEATDVEITQAAGLANRDTGAVDALEEVNAVRRTRGLAPFTKDDGLTQAAMSASRFRAERRIAGHTPNDFAHLPAGANAGAAGCAAWTPDWGWGSCCTYENWTSAGAAYVLGDDGRRYMHLFVR